MNYLLFSGSQDSGKTSSIILYKDLLVNNYHYKSKTVRIHHFDTYILDNGIKKIYIYPHSDQIAIIDSLVAHLDKNQGIYDAVITACRAKTDWIRDRIFKELDLSNPANYYFEIPLGRMIRGGRRSQTVNWYLDSVLNVAELVGKQPTFNF